MSRPYDSGIKVTWHRDDGIAAGTVEESFSSHVTLQLDGEEVSREADERNPAYLINRETGGQVLKSHSEIEPA